MTLILFSAPFSSRTHPRWSVAGSGTSFCVWEKHAINLEHSDEGQALGRSSHRRQKSTLRVHLLDHSCLLSSFHTGGVMRRVGHDLAGAHKEAERSKQTDVSDGGGGFEHSKGIWVTPWDKYLTDRLTSITTVITGMRSPWPVYESTLGRLRWAEVSHSQESSYNLWCLRSHLEKSLKRVNLILILVYMYMCLVKFILIYLK